jgi:hypothetical protein
MDKPTHGGKRKGAGRKPASNPVRTKKFRAAEDEWKEFLSLLDGDARKDFLTLLLAVNLLRDKQNDEVRMRHENDR